MTGGPIAVPAGYVVDRWRVGELIGSGAWGSVYAAAADEGPGPQDPDSPGSAALKFLPTAYLTPGQRALLGEVIEREARFSLRADHPHLIRTLAVHTLREPDSPDLDGAVVLVMERAVTNLRDLLASGSGNPADLNPEQLLAEIGDALAHMHAEGWVHGDLKPGNILIMSDGSARLADFGVTAQIDGTHAYAPRIGSSDYLPPEWWTERVGEKGIPLRTTADIWAFGVIAHQVLTGGLHPFPGAAQQSRAMAAQSYANGTTLLRLDAGITRAWREIVADCLAPDHESRSVHTAADTLTRIQAIRDGNPTTDPAAPAVRLSDTVTYSDTVALTYAGHGIDDDVNSAYDTVRLEGRRWSRVRRWCPGHGRRSRAIFVGTIAVALAVGGWWFRGDMQHNAPTTANQIALAGALRPSAPVPAQYRDMITKAARLCAEEEVTPSLIAAILKVESNFDPAFSDPSTASYGIAGWTPEVFHSWTVGNATDYMQPAAAIPAVSRYLCWLEQGYKQVNLAGDPDLLLAAGYDSSRKAVIAAEGPPAFTRSFAQEVARFAKEYES